MPAHDYRRFLTPAALHAATYPPPGSWAPAAGPGVIPLHRGYPFPAAVPQAELLFALKTVTELEEDLPFQYSISPTANALPGLLTDHCRTRGLVQAGDLLIAANGACHALNLAAFALLGPDDLVAMEGPTYMEALEIFRHRTPHTVVYPMDAEGLNTAEVEADLAARRADGRPLPKLFYTIPTFHNPTGTTMSLARREHLLRLAREYDFLILEDAAYAELGWEAPPPPLKALDRDGRVLYIGSLSKVVAPGLRVGWALGPEPIIRHLDLFKREIDPAFTHAMVAKYLQQNDLDQRIQVLRDRYRQRCQLLLAMLAEALPDGCRWKEPGGGYFVWVELPPHVDTGALLPEALAAGVSYLPGQHCYPAGHGGGRNQLRLCFTYVPPAEMETGVQILGRVLSRHL